MRRLKRIGLIAVGLLVIAGCGSSSSKPSGQTINLTRAAYISGGASGFRTVLSLQESIPSVGQLSVVGSGHFSVAAHTGSFTMQMSVPPAAAAVAGLGNLRLQMVLVPGTMYMKLPSQLASKIPGGKPWWKLDLSQLGKLAGIPGLSSLTSSSSTLENPGQYLDFLRATAQGSVTNLGAATVNGVSTTHYHARVDLAKLPNAVPASERAGVQALVGALQKRGQLPSGGLPIDVWIDSSHLIRQVELTYNQPIGSGQSAAVSVKANYDDYGPQPAPTVPPSGETVDLVSLLGQG